MCCSSSTVNPLELAGGKGGGAVVKSLSRYSPAKLYRRIEGERISPKILGRGKRPREGSGKKLLALLPLARTQIRACHLSLIDRVMFDLYHSAGNLSRDKQ